MAIGSLGITAGVSILALSHMNNRAFLSRCQTGASTVAQNQIDLILSDTPFNPQKSQIPPELVVGTVVVGSSTAPSVPIYTDPKTGNISVKGWMTTTVADTATTYNGASLTIYRATVTVSYSFRNRSYAVTMSTLRCSDI